MRSGYKVTTIPRKAGSSSGGAVRETTGLQCGRHRPAQAGRMAADGAGGAEREVDTASASPREMRAHR